MKYLSIIILFFCSGNLFAQTSLDYEKLLENNTITIHADSNQMKYVFDVQDKKISPSKHRIYHWYKSNQILHNQGSYAGKLLHGNFSAFHTNKKLAQQGWFKNGLKVGTWKQWSSNGLLTQRNTWKKGDETGKYFLYDYKGQIIEEGKKLKGKKHGEISSLDTLNNTYILSYFDKGTPISKDEYIQQSVWRRTGNFIQQQWKKLFRKKEEETSTVDSMPLPSN